MPRKNSFKVVWIAAISLAVLGIIASAVFFLFIKNKPYKAVYLSTGDIYFGRTSVFPNIKIKDAWFLQRSDDGNLGLQRFADAVWLPTGDININRDQVIFWTGLSKDSPIIQAIEGKVPPQQQEAAPSLQDGAQQQNGSGAEATTDDGLMNTGIDKTGGGANE